LSMPCAAAGFAVAWADRGPNLRPCHGSSAGCEADLGAALLTELPAHSPAFGVSPEYVFHSLGVRART
ncbi:MAG TPA: hypothetical protein VI029_21645, partial [Mycobacterium sp.]